MKPLFNILALFLLMLFSNNIMSQSYSLYCVEDYFVNATECDLCDEYGSGRQFFNGLVLDSRSSGKDILVRSPYDILLRGNTVILRDWTMKKVTINMSNIKNFSTPFSLLSYLKDCSGGTGQGGGGLSDGDYGDMTISGDGKIITLKNDIVGADELENTTVVAGTYNVSNITVDAQGRITSASAATADLLPLATPLSGNTNVEAALVYLDNKPEPDGSETKLDAGTNVTITGSGTVADPYVVNASSGTATVGDGDYGDVVVSSSGTVWTVTGGESTQVADLTALASSSFPIGTLVTVQNTGAVYKISATETANGELIVSDANSNSAKLQPNQDNLIVASQLTTVTRDVIQNIENYTQANGYKGLLLDINSVTIDHTLDAQDIVIDSDFVITGLEENRVTIDIIPKTPAAHNYNVFDVSPDVDFEISNYILSGVTTNTQTGAFPENSAETRFISVFLEAGTEGSLTTRNGDITGHFYGTIGISNSTTDATTRYHVEITNVDCTNGFGGGFSFFNVNGATCSFKFSESNWSDFGLTSAENGGNGDWSHGLYIHPNVDIIAENISVSDCARFAVNLRSTTVTDRAKSISFINCTFSDNGGTLNSEESEVSFLNCKFNDSVLSMNDNSSVFVVNGIFTNTADLAMINATGDDFTLQLSNSLLINDDIASQPMITLSRSGTANISGNTFKSSKAASFQAVRVDNTSLNATIADNTFIMPNHTGVAVSLNLGSHLCVNNSYNGAGDAQQINNVATTPPLLSVSNPTFQEIVGASPTLLDAYTFKATHSSADNDGIGLRMLFRAVATDNFTRDIGDISFELLDASSSRHSTFSIGTSDGSLENKLELDHLGVLKLNKYSSAGNYEASDLGKNESDYIAAYATDGTVVQKHTGSLVPPVTSVQSSDFTATAYSTNLVNTSSTTITVTVPASPVDDMTFTVSDASGNAATNNITIDFTGSSLWGSGGASTTITTNGGVRRFVYRAFTSTWYTY